jgi:hypothetical protein
MKIVARTCVPVLALLLFSAPPSQAQDTKDNRNNNMVVVTNPDAKAAAAYWTPERFKAARPLPLPQASSTFTQPQEEPRLDGQVESGDARVPILRSLPPAKRLFTPGAAPDVKQDRDGAITSPGAVGTFGAHYTSSRVFPSSPVRPLRSRRTGPIPISPPASCSFRSVACPTSARPR